MSKDEVLPGDAREKLFSRVEAMQRSTGSVDTASLAKRLTDFSTLPGYEELRLQRSIGEKFGLKNPYFRLHEGMAGARTVIGGRSLLNFSCYDYLGLNGHPEIIAAAKAAVELYGISCSGSRHVSGERPPHRSLERALADHYSAEEALVFVSGYATNVGVIGQLAGVRDLVVSDAVVHNSAVMGGVLSGATRRSFAHNDLDDLDRILTSVRGKFERALIVVEGLYSMDGDFPDLPRLIEIKKRHNAWLMIDEAHALGVLGARGYGLAEHYGVDPREIDIWMGTLSKTLVGCGGYIAGSAVMIDYLRLLTGAFVYSVGMPPVIAASAEKALEIFHREPERVAKLQHNGKYFDQYAKKRGLNTGTGACTSVCPVIVGDSIPAVLMSQQLFQRGINVLPVIHPAVPAKTGRLRFFLTAAHTDRDIETAIDVTAEELAKIPEIIRTLNVPGYPA
ncbi:MAG: aminotransferase class I/II-fold pyridoxal phosphate-dependent enzyme [Pseudolabrys sp.]